MRSLDVDSPSELRALFGRQCYVLESESAWKLEASTVIEHLTGPRVQASSLYFHSGGVYEAVLTSTIVFRQPFLLPTLGSPEDGELTWRVAKDLPVPGHTVGLVGEDLSVWVAAETLHILAIRGDNPGEVRASAVEALRPA